MKYLLLLVFTFSLLSVQSQKNKTVNSTDLIMECMKQGGEIPDKQMVLWYPQQLWELLGNQMGGSEEVMKIIGEEMGHYMMFAVVDYHYSQSGIRFKSEEDIRKTILLYDSTGKGVKPMEMNDLSSTAREMILSMKPLLEKMMGEFGEGMQLVLFDAKKIKGVSVDDLSGHGQFTLAWSKYRFTWQLPFASVLLPKKCPTDGESMKGNWNYCPVHGVKLD